MKKENESEYTLVDDDGIEDFLDDFIADMPLEILEEVRKQDIAAGEDTEIIDKAIRERKRRDKIIQQEQESQRKIEEAEQKKWRKIHRRAALYGLLNGLSNSKSNKDLTDTDNLMPWEEDLVKKKEYEPYHFEEEEMEEDDYYYEDD